MTGDRDIESIIPSVITIRVRRTMLNIWRILSAVFTGLAAAQCVLGEHESVAGTALVAICFYLYSKEE